MAKDKSSILENISDPANGTAKLDNQVVVLSDSLIKFALAVQKQAIERNGTYTIITTIYSLVEAINNNQLPPALDTMDNQELVGTIKDNFQNLPIIYHVQLMNQFIGRYYGQVISDITEDLEMDEQCIALSDQLMQSSEDFVAEVSVVPSPFEVVYLLAQYYLSAKTMIKEDLELGKFYMFDFERQKLFLDDFMERFTQQYKNKIE